MHGQPNRMPVDSHIESNLVGQTVVAGKPRWRTNEWRRTTPNDAEMTEQPGDNADPGSSSAEPRVP